VCWFFGMGAFSGWAGQLRLLTILIGIIDFGVTVDGYLHHYGLEEFFLTVVIICLICSCLIALALIAGLFDGADWAAKLDISFHVLAAIGLFIGGICMIVSVARFGKTYSKWFHAQRVSTGILGIINSIVYAIMALLLIRN